MVRKEQSYRLHDIIGLIMKFVYLVMLRYSLDGSPLDEAEDYAEQVRFIFADEDKAQLLADELESNYGKPDTEYYMKSHGVAE